MATQSTKILFGQSTLLTVDDPPEHLRPVIDRIASFGDLTENWDSYGAAPIEPERAVRAINFLLHDVPDDIPPPSVVPTVDGGVQVEWHRNAIDLEIEFMAGTQVGIFVNDHLSGEQCEFERIDDFAELQPVFQRLAT